MVAKLDLNAASVNRALSPQCQPARRTQHVVYSTLTNRRML